LKRYLSFTEIVAINARVIADFGGTHQLRDRGLLEAAIARPQSGYYADLFEEAAALFESLLQNHPFLDGNKRTAITATAVFLMLNGCKLMFQDLEAYNWLTKLHEEGKVRRAAIETWLRQHASPLEKD
jgi:death-on-curing protein